MLVRGLGTHEGKRPEEGEVVMDRDGMLQSTGSQRLGHD